MLLLGALAAFEGLQMIQYRTAKTPRLKSNWNQRLLRCVWSTRRSGVTPRPSPSVECAPGRASYFRRLTPPPPLPPSPLGGEGQPRPHLFATPSPRCPFARRDPPAPCARLASPGPHTTPRATPPPHVWSLSAAPRPNLSSRRIPHHLAAYHFRPPSPALTPLRWICNNAASLAFF